jgi:ankyrin repeat protein
LGNELAKTAESGNVEVLEKLWDWAKQLQLKAEELRNEVFLAEDESKETAWHKAARSGQFETLEKLFDWAK